MRLKQNLIRILIVDIITFFMLKKPSSQNRKLVYRISQAGSTLYICQLLFLFFFFFFGWFDSLVRLSQQYFSPVGTDLPGLNQ